MLLSQRIQIQQRWLSKKTRTPKSRIQVLGPRQLDPDRIRHRFRDLERPLHSLRWSYSHCPRYTQTYPGVGRLTTASSTRLVGTFDLDCWRS